MIQFEAADFHRAFGRAAKIASRNTGGAGNAFGVNIDANDDYALFSATDRTSIIEITAPCKVTTPTSVTLPHHIIDKVVAKAKGTVLLQPIESKRGPAVAVCLDGREVGDVSVIDEEWNVVMPGCDWDRATDFDDLANALSVCTWATAPNSTSPMIRSVHLAAGKLQATDANRLAEVIVSYAGEPVLIDVGPLTGALAKADKIRLVYDGKLLHLAIDGDTHFVTPTVTGVKYPNFDNIWSLATGARFSVSRGALLEAADVVTAVFDRDSEPWIVLDGDQDTLSVSFSGEYGELAEQLEVTDFEGEAFRIGLQVSYLRDALAPTKAEMVTIDGAKTVKGLSMLRIADDQGYRAAIATRRPD